MLSAEASRFGCGSAESEWAITGARNTILLVEDERFVREVTAEVLRSAGYAVVTAQNAGDAIACFEALDGSVDLLLTDIILPGEPGSVLAEKLRSANRELKVLFVTGYPEQMGRELRAREELLAKPFSTAALLKHVARLLEQKGRMTVDVARLVCDNASPALRQKESATAAQHG